MKTWTTETWVAGAPEQVLELLTEPDAIARCAPIPFQLLDLDGERLVTGTRARVSGALAGRGSEFDVEIHEADEERLSLVANGPVSIGAEYMLAPADGGSWNPRLLETNQDTRRRCNDNACRGGARSEPARP